MGSSHLLQYLIQRASRRCGTVPPTQTRLSRLPHDPTQQLTQLPELMRPCVGLVSSLYLPSDIGKVAALQSAQVL